MGSTSPPSPTYSAPTAASQSGITTRPSPSATDFENRQPHQALQLGDDLFPVLLDGANLVLQGLGVGTDDVGDPEAHHDVGDATVLETLDAVGLVRVQ